MGEDNNILPFGKYRGKTIQEVQLQDANYLEWLCTQGWFRDRFVVLHQTIINQGAPPEDTPEHNALQVLFLDNQFCLAVVEAAGWNCRAEFELKQRKYREAFEEKQRKHEKMQSDYIKEYERGGYRFPSWPLESKQEQEARQAFEAAVYDPLLSDKRFELDGVDVSFLIACEPVIWFGKFDIEIKPSVSDDYPTILRQILARTRRPGSGSQILFLDQFDARGATVQQFIEIFNVNNIRVVFRKDVKT